MAVEAFQYIVAVVPKSAVRQPAIGDPGRSDFPVDAFRFGLRFHHVAMPAAPHDLGILRRGLRALDDLFQLRELNFHPLGFGFCIEVSVAILIGFVGKHVFRQRLIVQAVRVIRDKHRQPVPQDATDDVGRCVRQWRFAGDVQLRFR